MFSKKARRWLGRERKRKTKVDFELFEERMLLNAQMFPVELTTDTTTMPTPMFTLRWAVEQAEMTGNADSTIAFQIPSGSGSVISLAGALPMITQQTIVDGTTESAFQPGVTIQIDGRSVASPSDGFMLASGSDHSTIKGLMITEFTNGIDIESTNDTISDNLIGTDGNPTHSTFGNQVGVLIDGSNGGSAATIGGMAGAANTIGFNTTDGVGIIGTGAGNNLVLGNFIGTNLSSADLGNGVGVAISDSDNMIGQAVPATPSVPIP